MGCVPWRRWQVKVLDVVCLLGFTRSASWHVKAGDVINLTHSKEKLQAVPRDGLVDNLRRVIGRQFPGHVCNKSKGSMRGFPKMPSAGSSGRADNTAWTRLMALA